MILEFIDTIVSEIAHILHPDRPRLVGENIHFATDLSADEVCEGMDMAAEAHPGRKNWRESPVDFLKLTHPDDPDGASSIENRTKIATKLGKPDYTGTAEQNAWLIRQLFKGVQQRGIPLPAAE